MSIEGSIGRLEKDGQCADTSERPVRRHQVALAHFVICQLLRTTAFRQQLRDMAALLRDVFEREGTPPPFEQPDKNEHAHCQTRFMLEHMTPLAATLCDKAWMLIPNDMGTPYWTSDHPVFMHNRFKDPYKGTLGLGVPGIEIYTPLSPSLTLLIYDPVERLPMYSVLPAIPANVTFVNEHQVSSSQRYIFANQDDFSPARRITDASPEIGDLKRPRVKAG
jgi:hypothetical protein